MAKRSIQVETQIENAMAVVASAETHRATIAAAAAAAVGALTAAQVEQVIEGLAQHLRTRTDALGAAEDAYVAEQADDVPLRDARDAAAGALLTLAVRVRSRVDEAFGANALNRYGLEGETPRTPKELASHVDTVIKLLRDAPREDPDPMGGTVSTAAMADALAALLAPLQAKLTTLVNEARENEGALTTRNRATESWARAYRGVATSLAGLYALAGRDDLADRIRPTVRREAGLEPTPGEPAPAPTE